MYRKGFLAGADDEEARLLKERHLSQDFRVLSAGLRQGENSDVDIYFPQQHYRMPTRLLDWTLNPLAALYFAAENDDDEGEIFLLDAYEFADGKGNKLKRIATSERPEFKSDMHVIFSWEENLAFQDNIN